MKKILLSTLVAGASVFAVSAHASGTINFDGELVAQTCDTNVNGVPTPSIATVSLPHVSVAALTAAGQVAGQTRFTIGLNNCVGTLTTAAAYFENGATVHTSGRLINTAAAGAGNVQLQLVDSGSNAAIVAGDSSQRTNNTHGTIVGGALSLPYGVQYYATGATTPGNVVSSVTYTIDYQ
ncbi:fimbrial protein [Variovorax saccharolyticus]|uniref:fimbrial protein n=1 Tax=Variovorax saccharolyticus TaxID=3053516 RepID=UPI0025760D6B|nr:fimbrial protein [Variovorax sp. J22R187]MDM0020135.1 fimbrial protein [Variovorax sp. J22R187]